ncbi:hypothetical protein D3C73_1127530 [compost metagenome]
MGDLRIDRLIGIADRRPDHPAVRIDLFLDEVRSIVCRREEAAELFLRVIDQNRIEDLALVRGDDRPVIGDEFGKQAEREEDQKNPEGPETALVCFEIGKPALAGRRQEGALGGRRCRDRRGDGSCVHQTSLRSKSMRGSIQV